MSTSRKTYNCQLMPSVKEARHLICTLHTILHLPTPETDGDLQCQTCTERPHMPAQLLSETKSGHTPTGVLGFVYIHSNGCPLPEGLLAETHEMQSFMQPADGTANRHVQTLQPVWKRQHAAHRPEHPPLETAAEARSQQRVSADWVPHHAQHNMPRVEKSVLQQ